MHLKNAGGKKAFLLLLTVIVNNLFNYIQCKCNKH